jgi:hypothetical protein
VTTTYSDIIDAMIDAEQDGRSTQRVELTAETMDSFLSDDKFTKNDEVRQKETIGTEWEIQIESGEQDVLVTEDGHEFEL